MSWYVVQTQSNAEEKSCFHLKNQGFNVYLPRYHKTIRHARKVSEVRRPLFPGYLFVEMSLENARWRSINGTIGVISLVQFGEKPMPVETGMLDDIRKQEDGKGCVDLVSHGLVKGDQVRVVDGAFQEYSALLEELSDDKRVILLFDLMGRQVRMSVGLDKVVKAS